MARKRKSKAKKGLILTGILFATTFMAIGYSVLSRELNFRVEANLHVSEKYLWHKIQNEYLSTSGSGFYKNSNETTKYSYMGDGSSNYIMLENDLWRIISVEADHTIKVVKLDDKIVKAFDEENNRNTTNSSYCTNPLLGCNSWSLQTSFTNGDITGSVENDSTILTYLNNDFYKGLPDTIQSIVVDHNFNIGPVNKDASLNEVLSQESKYSWNGKVGLLSISDILYASNSTTITTSSSLSNNYISDYAKNKIVWTSNPLYNDTSKVWVINNEGNLSNKDAKEISEENEKTTYNYTVLPVMYLSSSIQYSSGDGTQNNPFVIK